MCLKCNHIHKTLAGEERNPMHYCLNCDKWLGFRGFCSKKCHDNYYDKTLAGETERIYKVDSKWLEKNIEGELK